MDSTLFETKYLQFLNEVYDKVPSDEQKRIEMIINPNKAPTNANVNPMPDYTTTYQKI